MLQRMGRESAENAQPERQPKDWAQRPEGPHEADGVEGEHLGPEAQQEGEGHERSAVGDEAQVSEDQGEGRAHGRSGAGHGPNPVPWTGEDGRSPQAG